MRKSVSQSFGGKTEIVAEHTAGIPPTVIWIQFPTVIWIQFHKALHVRDRSPFWALLTVIFVQL